MMPFAMSCASSLAVVAWPFWEVMLEERAVRGFSSRMAPILRTTSGQAMVWMSACRKYVGYGVWMYG